MTSAPSVVCCGPLAVSVRAADDELLAKVHEALELFDVRWEGPWRNVELQVRWAEAPAPMGPGGYLTCARMAVDSADEGLRVTTDNGSSAVGAFSEDGERWSIEARPELLRGDPRNYLLDLEDIVELALTTGWRRAGWVPMHAATVVRDGTCAFLCAQSGGGKTTLTASLVRRGWRAVGDDKGLLRCTDDEPPLVKALQHSFNLDPWVRTWFPEVGDLEQLPRYSLWTEKRKVRIVDIWPAGVATSACPTHLVQVSRIPEAGGGSIEPLSPTDVLGILLRQTVVPSDPNAARPIVNTVVKTAQRLSGVRVLVPEGAYDDPRVLAAVEEALITS